MLVESGEKSKAVLAGEVFLSPVCVSGTERLRAFPPKIFFFSNTETLKPRSHSSWAALSPATPPPNIANIQALCQPEYHECQHGKTSLPAVSRPSEKFLIEPSRKFLLTALRLKDMERIENSQEERDKLEWLKRAKDGLISQCEAARKMGVTDRLGAQPARADEEAWRCSRGASVTGPRIQPEDRQPDTITGHEVLKQAEWHDFGPTFVRESS
jgi:hypothetical protein